MNKTWSVQTRYFVLGLIIVFLLVVAWFAREMIAPLIVAGLIAYLLYPLIEFLCTRLKMRRKVASHLVYFVCLALMIAIPATLLPTLINELKIVANDLLETLDQVEAYLVHPLTFGQVTVHLEMLVPSLKTSVAGFLAPLPEDAWYLIETTSKGALWFLVIVVGAYYFMTDWESLREWLIRLAPDDYRQDIRRLYLEIKKVWMAYLRGQLTLMIIVGVVFALIWSIIGLPGALILGILGGLFSLVPDVGPFVASALAFIVALLEGSTWLPLSNVWFAVLVAGLYILLVNIKSIWLRPRILGRSVRMHEGLVFISIIAAVIFTGILGAFIIVPVLASLGVIGRYLRLRILGLPPFPPVETVALEGVPLPAPEKNVESKPRISRQKKG